MTEKTRETIRKYADNFVTKNLIAAPETIANYVNDDSFIRNSMGPEIDEMLLELGKEKLADELRIVGMAKLAEKVMGEE